MWGEPMAFSVLGGIPSRYMARAARATISPVARLGNAASSTAANAFEDC
jgi:hypothetical protein